MKLQEEYRCYLESHTQLDDYWKKTIENRIHLSTATILFDALKSKEVNAYEVRAQLEEKGLYPYPRIAQFINKQQNVSSHVKYFLRNRVVFGFFARTRLLRSGVWRFLEKVSNKICQWQRTKKTAVL